MHSTARTRSQLVAVLGVTAMLLAACSQGSASTGTPPEDDPTPAANENPPSPDDADADAVTIRYMGYTANDGHEGDLDAIVAAFEDEHPDVDVEVQVLPFADYFTALQTAFAGGTVADVVDLNYENFVTYASNGVLAPLEGVNTAAYAPSLLDAFTFEGVQLGLPSQFSTVVMFYNRTLFDDAGIDYPTDDWSWDDAREAAEALTDTDAGVWGSYQPVSFHEFYKALAQAGGDFFNTDRTAATFASPEGIAAANWLIEKPGSTMPTEADGAGTPDFDTNLFAQGKLAMWTTGIWNFTPVSESEGLDWDVVVEPGDETQSSALFTDGVAVTAASEHRAAAQSFAEFLTGSVTAVETRLASSWSLPPVADQELLGTYLDQTPPDNREAVIASLDSVVLPPAIESQQEMQDIVSEELANAAGGRKSVEQALADAQERVTALLG